MPEAKRMPRYDIRNDGIGPYAVFYCECCDREYRSQPGKRVRPNLGHIGSFLRSLWVLGIKEKERVYYWRLLAWTLAIYGYHFRKVMEKYVGRRAPASS